MPLQFGRYSMQVSPSLEVRNYLRSSRFKGWLIDEYSRHRVLSEADLQELVIRAARRVLRRRGATAAFRVHSNRYMKDCGNHPDVSVSKNGRPRLWIELKDTKFFNQKLAQEDWKRLQTAQKTYGGTFKAGMLIYIARCGKPKVPPFAPTRKNSRLSMVVIALKDELTMNNTDFAKWNSKYRQLARCAAKP
jgi:hypothetical protein